MNRNPRMALVEILCLGMRETTYINKNSCMKLWKLKWARIYFCVIPAWGLISFNLLTQGVWSISVSCQASKVLGLLYCDIMTSRCWFVQIWDPFIISSSNIHSVNIQTSISPENFRESWERAVCSWLFQYMLWYNFRCCVFSSSFSSSFKNRRVNKLT